jgi:hypothetical protein
VKIVVKRRSPFQEVQIVEGSTTIDFGLLNDGERDTLAIELLCGVYAMGPNYNVACAEWIAEMFKRCNIDIPNDDLERPSDRQGHEVRTEVWLEASVLLFCLS